MVSDAVTSKAAEGRPSFVVARQYRSIQSQAFDFRARAF